MNRQIKRWTIGFVLAGILISLSAGCAQDIPDIDRTQPRAIKKEIFRKKNKDGSLREWYFRQTIIDVPYGSGATFIGEQGKTEKIVWEITERYLYAFRSREYVQNTDKLGKRAGVDDQQGSAIAAYRIEKHFDIQRGYNPGTGEQTNVIGENASDRPWHERKYIRVDFSQNMITDFTFIASNVKQQPVGYVIPENEKDNKDHAKLTDSYVDIVNKVFIQPEINELYSRYYGRPIPTCWLNTNITQDCLGQTIKVRSSFMLAKKSQYKKKEYDNTRMNKFGYFRGKNYKYDQGYGVVENLTSRVINRWNIWQDEKTCAKPGQKLSHANCKVKQIPYYLNQLFPKNLKPATAELFKKWNKNFADVVKARSGKDQGDVFVLCANNPVQKGDPAVCGKEGTNPQIGDLRYSFIYWVSNPHRRSPLGYGPSASDPITGEVFNANAFIYGAALERYANYATDLVRMVNGDLSGQNVAQAKQLLGYFKNLQKVNTHSHDVHVKLSLNNPKTTNDLRHIQKISKNLKKRIATGEQSYDWAASNLVRLANHPNNAALLSGEMFKAFGLHQLAPSGQVNQKVLDHFGPHKLTSQQFFSWRRDRINRLSGRNIMMADFVDDGILARALKLKKEFTINGKVDYKKAYEKVRHDIYLAVALHEVGHNFGLRHNFAASADALNYKEEYWKLRGDTIPKGSNEPLPFYRYTGANEKLLQGAVTKGLHEYQYSSIMDYGANFASDLQGLGKYDRAAILYGYGDLVEVFKKGTTVLNRETAKKALSAGHWHYTQLPRLVAGQKAYKEQIKSFTATSRTLATISELKSNKNLVEVPYKFCSDEYHHGTSECNRFDQGADPYERVHDMAQRYWGYYIINSFKRGRVEFGLNIRGYLSRVQSRYFTPITHQYKHFVNNGLVIRSGQKCGDSNNPWYADDRCGQAGFIASTAGLNFFSRVIQTPDAGCYKKSTVNGKTLFRREGDGSCPSSGAKGDYLTIPLGVGRQMLSGYDKETHGYEFYWKPNNIGSWWDKYLAVMALGNPYTRFLGIDRSGNTRSFLINYTNLFGRNVGNLVGAFLAGRPDRYGPVVTSGKVTYREEIGIAAQGFIPSPEYRFATSVDPDEQYTAKLLVGFIVAVYFSEQTDNQNINEAMKISVRGLSESPDIPESTRKDSSRYVEVVDPGSNRIYYASRTATTDATFSTGPQPFSTGFEMLNDIKKKYFEADGLTLKKGASESSVHRAFNYIKILMGWLRAGEYNKPR